MSEPLWTVVDDGSCTTWTLRPLVYDEGGQTLEAISVQCELLTKGAADRRRLILNFSTAQKIPGVLQRCICIGARLRNLADVIVVVGHPDYPEPLQQTASSAIRMVDTLEEARTVE